MNKNKKLIGYRKMAGLTQRDMALMVGMTQTTYSRKENGKADFTEKEMNDIYNVISKILMDENPDLKITDIFFNQN